MNYWRIMILDVSDRFGMKARIDAELDTTFTQEPDSPYALPRAGEVFWLVSDDQFQNWQEQL